MSRSKDRSRANVQPSRLPVTGDASSGGALQAVAMQPAQPETIELTQREAQLLDAGRYFGMAHAYAEAAKQLENGVSILRTEGANCQRMGERMLADAMKPPDTLKSRMLSALDLLKRGNG